MGLFLWALSREHHATVNRLLAQRSNLTGRVEELTAKVAELEEVVPVVSFGVPRTEEQVPVMGGTQPFAFGVVRNDQKRPGFGETARDAIVFLTVEGLGGERIMGPIKGRWRDAPSPVQLPAFQHHTHLESIDLQANGDEREFDIATKSLSEPYCYVIDAKQVLHKIPVLGVMLVQVEVRGKNFAPVRDTLTLNTKGYGEGLDVWRATS